jgi:hypothetical protein
MYLTLEFSIKDGNVSENLNLLVSLHSLDTKLILVITTTYFNNVFVLGVLSDNQGVSFTTR